MTSTHECTKEKARSWRISSGVEGHTIDFELKRESLEVERRMLVSVDETLFRTNGQTMCAYSMWSKLLCMNKRKPSVTATRALGAVQWSAFPHKPQNRYARSTQHPSLNHASWLLRPAFLCPAAARQLRFPPLKSGQQVRC